jgi:general secretion pathway protein L
MSRRVLGLEIREASIAGVLLEAGFKSSVPVAQGCVPIPADKADDAGIGEALATLMETLKPAGAACVLGIPTAFISFRNLSMPFHDIRKIRQVLPFELEPTLPMPIDELAVDFEAVKNDGQQDILAFAVKKTRLQRYLNLLEAVNLRPVLITPGSYAAARLIAGTADEKDDFLFVDTGEGSHTVYAVCSGRVRMVRSLPIGGGGFPVIRSIEMTLQRTFTALKENQGIAINPVAVFSMGPQSHLLSSGDDTLQLMNAPVKSIAAIRTFPRLTGPTDTPDWASGNLDIALALALMETEAVGGVNFSTKRSTVQHYWNEYRRSIMLTAALIVLTVATALTGQIFSVNAKERRLAELDRQVETVFKSTFPDVTRIVDPLQQMRVKIREAGENDSGLQLSGTKARVIDILNTLSQQIPSSVDVQVNRMVVSSDNVTLSGHTATFNTVDDIKGRLESAEIFSNVTISSADLEKSGQRVRFKLKLDL